MDSSSVQVKPEVAASIFRNGFLRDAPMSLNFDETMFAKLGSCLEEVCEGKLEEENKELLKQKLEDALAELRKKSPEDFRKGLEELPPDRHEDVQALPTFVQNLISAQRMEVGCHPDLLLLTGELAKRIKEVVGGTGEPSSSVSNVNNYKPPRGEPYDPRRICDSKEALIYTGNGIGAEEYNSYAAFCKGHQDMESRMIPFSGEVAKADDSRRRMISISCLRCLELRLHPFALFILNQRPHTASTVAGRLLSVAAAQQVWSPDKTESTLRLLAECMWKVIAAFREWITPKLIKPQLWPQVARNFPNTAGSQTLLMRLLDALLLIEDPTDEEFKRNARAVRERCTKVQGERLDFLLEAVDAWLPLLHSSEANTQLYKHCQFLLLLLRAVHLRRILQIGGPNQSLKKRLETLSYQILKAIDPDLVSKERIILEVDGVRRDCTQYVRESLHPAGDAILMASNGKDVTDFFHAVHAKKTKEVMIKHCPEVRPAHRLTRFWQAVRGMLGS
ncbi:unnamed protein product [Symbiodinium sp. CCMP2592]|nr:unnamed protein product [Symbiodinium sp. CCMP2592]